MTIDKWTASWKSKIFHTTGKYTYPDRSRFEFDVYDISKDTHHQLDEELRLFVTNFLSRNSHRR